MRNRNRTVAALLILCSPAVAQFDNLVTNDDGSVLYFSSSLRMRGSGQFDHRKLFVADAAGIRLHTQRERRQIMVPESGWPVTTYYSMESAAVTGDGASLGLIARRECLGGSGCLPVPKYETEIGGREYRGRMNLSRNGRFALLWGDGSLASFSTLIDLTTGQHVDWRGTDYSPPRYGRRRVTSDGVALSTTQTELAPAAQLRLVRLDSSRVVPVPDVALEAVIDDLGKTAVYEAAIFGDVAVPSTLGGRKLMYVNLETGATRQLSASSASPMQPCLSNDGQVVLFRASRETAGLPQMYSIRSDGTDLRQITRDASGITEIVLSGNGKVAYAVAGSGRILRFDLEFGSVRQLVGRSLSLAETNSSTPPYPVPGSAFTIAGTGLADAWASAGPPLPLALNGLQLLLDGRPVPLQTVAPTRIVFQLPWDVTPGRHRLEARTDVDSVFETDPVELDVRNEAFGQFEFLQANFRPSISGQPYALAAHQDFGSLVAAETPARPGEIVHLYMTGLGPVEPAVETGAPGPADPPARVRLPFSCRFGQRPADILFAGLAPGFAGYYQVSIRIPEDIGIFEGDAILACGFSAPGGGSIAWLPIRKD